ALERENQDKKRRAKQRQKTDYKFDPQKLKRKSAGKLSTYRRRRSRMPRARPMLPKELLARCRGGGATGAPARAWSEETSAEGPAAVKAGEESTASLRQKRQLEQLKRMQTRETIDSLARTDSHADLGDAGRKLYRMLRGGVGAVLKCRVAPLLSSGSGFCGSVSLIRSLTACCHAEPHGDKGALEATEADALHDRDNEAEGQRAMETQPSRRARWTATAPAAPAAAITTSAGCSSKISCTPSPWTPFFELFITCCIMLNTLFMATEHYPMDKTYELVLDTTNYIFTGIFTFEAVIKITAMSRQYFQSGWNVFDLIVVIASLVDVGVEGIKGLSIFRTFRLLHCRSVRLGQRRAALELRGLRDSMLMVFRILCGEWIEALWDCMRARGELCVVVFIPSLILGHFMVLNLFLALLLNSFSNEKLAKDDQDKEESSKFAVVKQRLSRLLAVACQPCLRLKCCLCGLAAAARSRRSPRRSALVRGGLHWQQGGRCWQRRGRAGNGEVSAGNGEVGAGERGRSALAVGSKLVGSGSVITVGRGDGRGGAAAGRRLTKARAPIENGGADAEARPVAEAEAADSVEPEGAAAADLTEPAAATEEDEEAKEELEKLRLHDCCCEPCYSPCRPGTRLACFRCSTDNRRALRTCTIDEKATTKLVLKYLKHQLFTVLFAIEMRYFSQFWTFLDFFIVVGRDLHRGCDVGRGGGNGQQPRRAAVLRALRAFRPLRTISRWEGMKATFEGWMEVMRDAIDMTRHFDLQPEARELHGVTTIKRTSWRSFLTPQSKSYYNTMRKRGKKKADKDDTATEA
uniref:Ion_trans domain-containing protein n=1 Tax=Macrostomum lignano TaxID=282301 RepID=A0A1I8JQN6_9PLAT